MKTITYYTRLIKLIKKVHFKISLIILHKQVLNYRKDVSHSSGLSEEIRLTIKHLIQDSVLNINNQNNSMDYKPLENKNSHSKHAQTIDRKDLGGLAKYFKERNNKDVFNSIERKLEKSATDHMHEAIRYARQGDERSAHMHADIASSSCEELAHFISKEQYHEFVGQMKHSLESFKVVT